MPRIYKDGDTYAVFTGDLEEALDKVMKASLEYDKKVGELLEEAKKDGNRLQDQSPFMVLAAASYREDVGAALKDALTLFDQEPAPCTYCQKFHPDEQVCKPYVKHIASLASQGAKL